MPDSRVSTKDEYPGWECVAPLRATKGFIPTRSCCGVSCRKGVQFQGIFLPYCADHLPHVQAELEAKGMPFKVVSIYDQPATH